MYEILLYEDQNGKSEINDYLMELAEKAEKAENNKDARIQFKQITLILSY